MGHPNTKKHKREHCGYKKRPGKKEVNALLDMYAGIAGINIVTATSGKGIPKLGTQLKLNL